MDLPPPSYDETFQAVVQCEIAQENVSVAYDDLMQADVVTISDLGELTDRKLGCLKHAIHPFYILTIENGEQSAAFYEFSRREDRPIQRAEATEWLRTRNLLDRLPAFDPDRGLEKFATDIEIACGVGEGSALVPLGTSSLILRHDFIQAQDLTAADDILSCVMHMFTASDAQEHEVSLGFIGNEAVEEGDDR